MSLDKTTLKDLLENLELDEDCPSTEYYTPSEVSQINLKKSDLYIHLNIFSLSYYIDELHLLLSQMKHRPKIIAISESRIRKNKELLSNINITGYDFEYTYSESEKGGTLIYVSQDLKYKNRKDLIISKSKELELTFVEIIIKNKRNMIVGCIHKHPNMSISELNSDFLVLLLNKISLEKKEVILLGENNINLLNCDSDKNTSEFLELMLSYSFLPRIIKPTRITPRTNTLIENIFVNGFQSNIIAGNITTDISDHLTQFISIRHEGIPDIENYNTNICRRNYNKLNHDKKELKP